MNAVNLGWSRWVDLALGLLGLIYLIPPYKARNVGSAIVSIGFLIRFVCQTIWP